MCGVYGITDNNPSLVKKLIKKSAHRGPDGNSIWANNNLTLGHNLLSITSKPNEGKQPWVSEKGNVLVYNCEIFNYLELISKFKNKFVPKTSCDTELLSWLLDNYSCEEVICNIIDSMHAFVFFNKKTNELILSRDHVGIKQLYFAENKNRLELFFNILSYSSISFSNQSK